MMISAFVPMKRPPTVTGTNGKRTDRRTGRVYDSPALARARAALMDALGAEKPEKPLDGALSVKVTWCYPIGRNRRQGEPYTGKPDADNAAKLPLDCMQRTGWFADDRQIAELIVTQAWAEPPGLYVEVREIGCKDSRAIRSES